MTDVRTVKDELARLARRDRAVAERGVGVAREVGTERGVVTEREVVPGSGLDDPAVVERAERAVADVEAAARFRTTVGLARLGAAVAATDGVVAERGRAALSAFEAFEAAARTDGQADQHFRRGHGTALRGDGKRGGNDAGDPHR